MSKWLYNPNHDYCDAAKNEQTVLSRNQYLYENPDTKIINVDAGRANTLYSCADDFQMGTIQDDYIYIATTDGQHDQIAQGMPVTADRGLRGFFSDPATVDACITDGVMDNAKYNKLCQIAPYRGDGIDGSGDASYKPHIDCFQIDRDALFENYGTYDFNAAIAKCTANNQFGEGGGNQGYLPHLAEMIENGTLKFFPQKSYSDESIKLSQYYNPNELTNSVVDEADYDAMLDCAQMRAQDCVNNNTPHPSQEACNNGFPLNPNPIQSNTGHATPVHQSHKDQENINQGENKNQKTGNQNIDNDNAGNKEKGGGQENLWKKPTAGVKSLNGETPAPKADPKDLYLRNNEATGTNAAKEKGHSSTHTAESATTEGSNPNLRADPRSTYLRDGGKKNSTNNDDNKDTNNEKSDNLNKGTDNEKPDNLNKGQTSEKSDDLNKETNNEKPDDLNKGTNNEKSDNLKKGTDNEKPDDLNKGSNSEKPDDLNRGTTNEKPEGLNKGTTNEKPDDLNKGTTNEKPDDLNKGTTNEKPDDLNKGTTNEKPDDLNKGPSKDDIHR